MELKLRHSGHVYLEKRTNTRGEELSEQGFGKLVLVLVYIATVNRQEVLTQRFLFLTPILILIILKETNTRHI